MQLYEQTSIYRCQKDFRRNRFARSRNQYVTLAMFGLRCLFSYQSRYTEQAVRNELKLGVEDVETGGIIEKPSKSSGKSAGLAEVFG